MTLSAKRKKRQEGCRSSSSTKQPKNHYTHQADRVKDNLFGPHRSIPKSHPGRYWCPTLGETKPQVQKQYLGTRHPKAFFGSKAGPPAKRFGVEAPSWTLDVSA